MGGPYRMSKYQWTEKEKEGNIRKFVVCVNGQWYYTAFLEDAHKSIDEALKSAERLIDERV
jgi:VCBS repeat-containing protein